MYCDSKWNLVLQITCIEGVVTKLTVPLTRMKAIDVSCVTFNNLCNTVCLSEGREGRRRGEGGGGGGGGERERESTWYNICDPIICAICCIIIN